MLTPEQLEIATKKLCELRGWENSLSDAYVARQMILGNLSWMKPTWEKNAQTAIKFAKEPNND